MIIRPSGPLRIEEALAVLRGGGVVAHATETCYGLACDLTNPAAVAKLFAIKKRPLTQPVSALFASLDDAKRYVEWNDRAEELAAKYLPGPLTLILSLRADAPHPLHPTPPRTSDSGQRTEENVAEVRSPKSEVLTIGLRISSHPLAQKLVSAFGFPLSTTSANIHGEPNPYDAQVIFRRFEKEDPSTPLGAGQPDLIIDSGTLPPVPPSTVMDLTQGEATLRKGATNVSS